MNIKEQLQALAGLQANLRSQEKSLDELKIANAESQTMVSTIMKGILSSQIGGGGQLFSTIYDDNNSIGTSLNQHNYVGTPPWTLFNPSTFLNNTGHYSNVLDQYFDFQFSGSRIEWYTEKFPHHGIAGVSIDGGAEQTVDLYDPTPAGVQRVLVYTSTQLSEGQHTIRIRVTHTKNAASTDFYVIHDYFKVYTSVAPPSSGAKYYVGGTGASDGNTGLSPSVPFATIGKAASLVVPGDTVDIMTGVYRETIVMPVSGSSPLPIIFRAAAGQTPVISGFDLVGNSGWSNTGTADPNIYKKAITLPVTGFRTAPVGIYGTGNLTNAEVANNFIFANQIVKNGSMIIEASFPKGLKTQSDYFSMSATNNMSTSQWIHVSQTGSNNLSPSGVTDTHLDANFAVGDLVGATLLSQGWYVSNSSTVTSHTSNRLNTSVHNNRYGGPGAFWKYYRLTNHIKFLTQENEFYYGGGNLYVWQPGGGTPTNIEYKARNSGFDLRGRSFIQIRGITFIGCDPATGNASTNNCTIDNIRASLMNHTLTHSAFLNQGHGMAQFLGMKLGGSSNVVKDSEFSYSGTMCIWIGPNGLVQNNKFDHIGYDGMWGAPVAWWGIDNCNGISVLNNTATVMGRGFVDNGFGDGPNQTGQDNGSTHNTMNNEIGYNDVSYFSSRVQDGGAFYSSQYQNLSGMKVHHNWFHDMTSFKPPDGSSTDGIMSAIYFDQGSGANTGGTQVRVYNNVIWNIGGANISFVGQTNLGNQWNNNSELSDIYSHPYCTGCGFHPAKLATLYYNNTCASGVPGTNGVKSFVTNQTVVTDVFNNNIFLGEYGFSGGTAPGNFGSTNKYRANVSFVGGSLATPQVYFQLQAGSSARGIGISVPTNSDDTPPLDAGAYYYQQTAWGTPGYVAVPYTP